MATNSIISSPGVRDMLVAELTDLLLKNGHSVKIVDTFYFETQIEESKNLTISKKGCSESRSIQILKILTLL